MSGYSIFNRQRFSKYLCCVGCALLMILATGCGDKASNPETTEQVTTDSTATGSAVLSIQWHRASTDSYTTSAPVRQAIEDCAGVASITCQVYDENDNLIANGGPWLCVDKQGRIDRIPVGANRTFAVLGWDAQEGGNIVYQGRTASGIDISPRQIADAGTIDAYPFVPLLSNPADGQNVTVNAFSLTWDSVANAYAYRILVSEDSNFTSPVMDETTTETIYAPLNLSGSTTYYWMIRAIDIHGNESADSQVWSFITNDVDVCMAPVLDPIGNRQVDEGNTLTFTLSATDPDSGNLTYSHSSLPTGAEFNQETNTFSWTPGYGAAGNYSVTFTVCDDCPDEPLCDSEEVTITVGNVCRPPVLDTIGSRRIIEGNQLTFTANASDPDTGDELTFSVSNLPTGAQFNQNTRTFTWTPNYHDAGTYTVRIQVCDNCAQLCDFEDVTITVAHGNPIVGEWEERVDIDCDGGAGINTLIFHADNTFESEPRCSEYTGTWSLEGDSISFYYTACDYSDYSGTIDETGTQMSGRMGNGEHCWSATKID